MPKAEIKLPVAEFVKQIVTDPAKHVETLLLCGFIGSSSEKNHTRLYFDAQLSQYVEIPDKDILYSQPLAPEASPLGAVYVWIEKAAQLTHGKAGAERSKASFFEGPIALAGAGGATPPPVHQPHAITMIPGGCATHVYTPLPNCQCTPPCPATSVATGCAPCATYTTPCLQTQTGTTVCHPCPTLQVTPCHPCQTLTGVTACQPCLTIPATPCLPCHTMPPCPQPTLAVTPCVPCLSPNQPCITPTVPATHCGICPTPTATVIATHCGICPTPTVQPGQCTVVCPTHLLNTPCGPCASPQPFCGGGGGNTSAFCGNTIACGTIACGAGGFGGGGFQ